MHVCMQELERQAREMAAWEHAHHVEVQVRVEVPGSMRACVHAVPHYAAAYMRAAGESNRSANGDGVVTTTTRLHLSNMSMLLAFLPC